MKELDTTAAETTAKTTAHESNSDRRQGAAAAMLQSTRSSLMYSAAKAETFDDMYDYECDNSSTSTGFDEHDDELDVDEKEDDEEEDQQGRREVDRRFHLQQHHNNNFRLRMQHHYSDEDEGEEASAGRRTTIAMDHAHHHRALEHSHGGNPAEEEEVQAAAIILTNTSAADNCVNAIDDMLSSLSSSLSHSYSSSAPESPNPDADGSHQSRDDYSTPPPPPRPQSEQQHTQHGNTDTSSTQQNTTISSPTAPPELNPKSPSRLSIPRSILFRANTPTDRSLGAGSPLGRLQIHTVNRLEVENSFLLNQNNSISRDIHHCRQTVQALKQILAQREDTIGRMKQEAHQAHLKIKFMESLLSNQRSSHPGQLQGSHQLQPQQQYGPRYQPQQQQDKRSESDWKERHRQDDSGDEEEEERGRGVEGKESVERSTSLLDMYAAAQDEPPFNWLLKGWDEGEMTAAEAEDNESDRGSAGDNEEEEEEEEEDEELRDIPRQVRSIFSGMNDDEQYNSDEYTDEDYDEDYDEDDDEGGEHRPISGDFQEARIYRHHNSQHLPLSGSSNVGGESCGLLLSMSLGNNSTCILTQESNSEHDDNDGDEDACNTDDVAMVNDDGCVFISGDRQPSPVSIPSPDLSESSMSLESQPEEASNGSVTSLSCSSLSSTSASTSNTAADEKDELPPPQQQQQLQQVTIELIPSSTSLQGLQLPAVVPYSSFRDSGHFPTQVFTMDYEEQHLIVVDDTDMQSLPHAQEFQLVVRPFSPTTTASLLVHNNDSDDPMISSSPPSSAVSNKGLSINTGNGLTTAAAALIQAKDTSYHVPFCQPNGSHPCLGTSPPMAAPLALISRVHIEVNASSTTLVSASTPSPMATTRTAATGGSITHGRSTLNNNSDSPSTKEVVTIVTIKAPSQVDREAVTAEDVARESSSGGGDDVIQSDSPGSSTPSTPTTTSWGPSSLFKGWLPSRRKNKTRSTKSKYKDVTGEDGRLSSEGGGVMITGKEDDVVVVETAKEQSVAWTMLKNQSSPAIEPLAAVERAESPPPPAPIASGPASTSSSTLLSRVFSGRSNRSKT
ncbi:hypothetical protein BGZ96_003686 [Linnemannia gamsii]|uniref:Uncharacterized protein n=1 Tax=Linnemannia gamsii TaxID=64522 RepID=A0ABQ7K6M1_9FUNG|nr:hypothetical protein BGZ96_003686 [Linnemannia gamsii]